MSTKFEEKVADPAVSHDIHVLGKFAEIYCKAHHRDAGRDRLDSQGVRLGAYGRRAPRVCPECASLLAYGEKRRALCPFDPKPQCKNCETHCYRPDMRQQMRDVMRYGGPRAAFHGMAIDAVKHKLDRPWAAHKEATGR